MTATDGSDVLPLLLSGAKFDAILLDENMRVINGTGAARLIREWEADSQSHCENKSYLPLICVTGEMAHMRYIRMSGMDAFVNKPVNVKAISESIRTYLAEKKENLREPKPPAPPKTGTDANRTRMVGCLNIFESPLYDFAETRLSYPLVMAVDDEPANNRIVERVLSKGMFRVVCRDDGSQVLPTLIECDFKCDLILLDEMMKDVNGTAAARQVRAYEKANGVGPIPIISLTANSTAADVDKYHLAGIDGMIAKPFSVKQLANTVNLYLNSLAHGVHGDDAPTPKRVIGCATIFPKRAKTG